MSLNMNAVRNKEKARQEYVPVPRGSHIGILVGIIDLGLQPRLPWKGVDKKPAYRIRLTFELPKQRIEVDGESRPRWLDKEINVSTFENSEMVKMYSVLDPDDTSKGDWSKLIGRACAVVVTNEKGQGKHEGKVFDNISDITPLMDGIDVPELENPPRVFDLSSPSREVWDKLPEFIQNKIKANLEFNGSKLQAMLSGEPRPVTASTPELDLEVELDAQADDDKPW